MNVMILELKKLVSMERQSTSKIVQLIGNIDQEKIYIEMGYSTLMRFCIKELKYSESAARRRIAAARLCKKVPEVVDKISKGELNLTNVAMAQSFFYAEGIKDPNKQQTVMGHLLGLETDDAQKFLLGISETGKFKRKNYLRRSSPHDFDLTVTLSEEVVEKLKRIKDLKSHTIKNFEELLGYMTETTLNAIDPMINIRSPKKRETVSRCPTAAMAEFVMRKAGTRCEFVHKKTGERCTNTAFLQIDHKKKFSLGGRTAINNLQVLCGLHNRYKG